MGWWGISWCGCSNVGLALLYPAVFFCVIGKRLVCTMAFKVRVRDTVMDRDRNRVRV